MASSNLYIAGEDRRKQIVEALGDLSVDYRGACRPPSFCELRPLTGWRLPWSQRSRIVRRELCATPGKAPASGPVVPRRQPLSAEVQQAIVGMREFVRTILTPTYAHVNDLGGKVCTAFDQGQTGEQVKATGLAMVSKVPFTTVLPGADDYVVRTAINLYCPGHLYQLLVQVAASKSPGGLLVLALRHSRGG